LRRSAGTPSARRASQARPSIGRLGDIATKLPDEVIKATPEIPWREVKGMRIIAAHAYHRIDYEEVWVTLRDDVRRMDQAIKHWRRTQA
jgi:uncharacterized protein with HEPN domain